MTGPSAARVALGFPPPFWYFENTPQHMIAPRRIVVTVARRSDGAIMEWAEYISGILTPDEVLEQLAASPRMPPRRAEELE